MYYERLKMENTLNQYFREGDQCVGGIGRMNEAMGGWVV